MVLYQSKMTKNWITKIRNILIEGLILIYAQAQKKDSTIFVVVAVIGPPCVENTF